MKKELNGKLIIKISRENDIILELIKSEDKKRVILDSLQWEDQGDTSTELLGQIDTFLQKNELQINDLEKVEAKIDEGQKYTLARIVKIVTETINYCLR